MRRLFLFLIIPLILGIYFSYKVDIDLSTIIILLSVSIFALIISIFLNKGYSFYLFLIFIMLGMLLTLSSLKSNLSNFIEEDIILKGIVKKQINHSEGKSSYIVLVNNILHENKYYKTKEIVLLNYYSEKNLDIGNEIMVEGQLLKPSQNTNPGLFNYRLYLQTKNIHFLINCSEESLEVLSKGKISKSTAIKIQFQKEILNILDRALDEKNSNIVSTIVLGDRSFLDDETSNRFRELGLSHILAISGLHIGIIYLFISYALRFLGISKRLSICLSLLFIWSYGYFISFPISVVRASVMFSILSLSNVIYRRYDSINSLSLAALILLLIQPLWVFDIGFQLSFVATASILLFNSKIRIFLTKYNKSFAKIFSPILSVQIGLLPILAYHFNSYAVLSFISNVILIPLYSIILVLVFLLIALSFFSINFAIGLGVILNTLLDIANLIIDVLYKFSFANITLPSLSLGYILIYYCTLLICFKIIRIDFFVKKLNKLILSYIFMVIIYIIFRFFTLNETVIEFIDVGQGDSCLISTKYNTILIDTGGSIFGEFDVGEKIVLPYLLKKGVNKLDAVFITHFHEDHSEGLLTLIENIKIDNLFIGYEAPFSQLYNDIMYYARINDVEVKKLSKGDLIYLDKHNIIEVHNPSFKTIVNHIENENNLSLVLELDSYNKKILFTGDIESEIEQEIVNDNRIEKIDILKVPHHGSKTSSTENFLKKLRPSYAVIQVGKNSFGHPNQDVINRYNEIGAKVYRNDECGLIKVSVSHDYIKIDAYIKDKPALSNIIEKNLTMLIFVLAYIKASLILCFIYKDTLYSSNTLSKTY